MALVISSAHQDLAGALLGVSPSCLRNYLSAENRDYLRLHLAYFPFLIPGTMAPCCLLSNFRNQLPHVFFLFSRGLGWKYAVLPSRPGAPYSLLKSVFLMKSARTSLIQIKLFWMVSQLYLNIFRTHFTKLIDGLDLLALITIVSWFFIYKVICLFGCFFQSLNEYLFRL